MILRKNVNAKTLTTRIKKNAKCVPPNFPIAQNVPLKSVLPAKNLSISTQKKLSVNALVIRRSKMMEHVKMKVVSVSW